MFALKKILERLIAPTSLAICCLLWLAVCSRSRSGKQVALFGLLALLPPSLPFSADFLQACLESKVPAVPLRDLPQGAAIVVLGGTIYPHGGEAVPAEEIAGSRLVMAARLFRLGKAPRIVVSSGVSYEGPDHVLRTEAEDMRDLLQVMGIPPEAITLEQRSLDTQENARYTAELFRNENPEILLVTSAYHAFRACMWFEKAGFRVHPVGTGRMVRPHRSKLSNVLPSAIALARSTSAIKEYLGLLPLVYGRE